MSRSLSAFLFATSLDPSNEDDRMLLKDIRNFSKFVNADGTTYSPPPSKKWYKSSITTDDLGSKMGIICTNTEFDCVDTALTHVLCYLGGLINFGMASTSSVRWVVDADVFVPASDIERLSRLAPVISASGLCKSVYTLNNELWHEFFGMNVCVYTGMPSLIKTACHIRTKNGQTAVPKFEVPLSHSLLRCTLKEVPICGYIEANTMDIVFNVTPNGEVVDLDSLPRWNFYPLSETVDVVPSSQVENAARYMNNNWRGISGQPGYTQHPNVAIARSASRPLETYQSAHRPTNSNSGQLQTLIGSDGPTVERAALYDQGRDIRLLKRKKKASADSNLSEDVGAGRTVADTRHAFGENQVYTQSQAMSTIGGGVDLTTSTGAASDPRPPQNLPAMNMGRAAMSNHNIHPSNTTSNAPLTSSTYAHRHLQPAPLPTFGNRNNTISANYERDYATPFDRPNSRLLDMSVMSFNTESGHSETTSTTAVDPSSGRADTYTQPQGMPMATPRDYQSLPLVYNGNAGNIGPNVPFDRVPAYAQPQGMSAPASSYRTYDIAAPVHVEDTAGPDTQPFVDGANIRPQVQHISSTAFNGYNNTGFNYGGTAGYARANTSYNGAHTRTQSQIMPQVTSNTITTTGGGAAVNAGLSTSNARSHLHTPPQVDTAGSYNGGHAIPNGRGNTSYAGSFLGSTNTYNRQPVTSNGYTYSAFPPVARSFSTTGSDSNGGTNVATSSLQHSGAATGGPNETRHSMTLASRNENQNDNISEEEIWSRMRPYIERVD